MVWVVVLCVLIAVLWAVSRFMLRGEDLTRFDALPEAPTGTRTEPSATHFEVVADLNRIFAAAGGGAPGGRTQLATIRKQMDELGDAADTKDIRIVQTVANGVPAEWVLAPGFAADCRLLYVHGGAFTMGSPRSHRVVTTSLARLTRAAVLAIDYRLMPEHPRQAGIEDCRTAYRWIAARGPDGISPARVLFVAGDSAGGNLSLMLAAWARDAGERLPDAVVALSPSTDATFGSPSLKANVATDPMLGPAFSRFLRVPRSLLLWGSWLMNRIKPSDPIASPVMGDLSRLPPILIQASEAEMLIDDARRYTNKARLAGSSVTLQTWPFMVHVWHIFANKLPEAKEALERIGEFLRTRIDERARKAG